MSSPVSPAGPSYGGAGRTRRPRRGRPLVLVLLLVVVPLLELWVLIQVGQVIGGWPTVGLLLASAVLGGWLVRREGRRAWAALSTAVQAGQVPTREIADAGLVLLGGLMMIAPGFVTDVLGLLLVLPLTRPLARGLLAGMVARRVAAAPVPPFGPFGPTTPNGPRPSGRRPAGGDVVQGEVVDSPGEH